MVRFYWKKASVTAGTDATKSKILKNVAFPLQLDTYPFCSEDLKKSLKFGRDFELKQRKEEDDKILAGLTMKEEEEKKEKSGDVEMKDESKEEESKVNKKQVKKKQVLIDNKHVYQTHGTGLDTGNYHLVGVVTHKGRSADSGHYVGWVHKSDDDWLKYDDDIVSKVSTEDILQLKGGGDWHMSYLLLYRKMETKVAEASESEDVNMAE